MRTTTHNFRAATAAALLSVGALAGCGDFDIGNLNNPELVDFQDDPTFAAVRDGVQGLQIGMRLGVSSQTGFVPATGTIGREAYIFDAADPRFNTEYVAGQLNASGFGGGNWGARYANVRLAELVLDAVADPTIQEGASVEDLEAIRGFVKTIEALDLLLVQMTRDDNGVVLDVDVALGETPGPLLGRTEALAGIAGLLDEAAAHLDAAGADFPFRLAPGFDGFDDPASFLEFNRALAARVATYRERYDDVLTALAGSFVSTGAPLDAGVYYTYGGGAGDTFNGIATSPNVFAHPSLLDDAQTNGSGELDRRADEKLVVLAEAETNDSGDLSTTLDFALYDEIDAPIAIVKNEGLLLLRAEARWFTGDPDGAMEDLNFVRESSGGLEPLAVPATDEAFVDALLYERRYSLLMEGVRWVDARRFDRLDELPLDRPGDRVAPAFPVPRTECQARGLGDSCSAG